MTFPVRFLNSCDELPAAHVLDLLLGLSTIFEHYFGTLLDVIDVAVAHRPVIP